MTLSEKTQTAAHIAVVVLCFVVAGCCVVITGKISFLSSSLTESATSISSTMQSANESLIDIDSAVQTVNGKAGTLVEVDKLLLALKSTTVHIDLAARHENQQLTILDTQERQLFADLHGTAVALTGTALQATNTLSEAQTSVKATQPLLEAYTASGNDLDAILRDQAIHRILTNMDAVSLQASFTAQNVAGVTADGKKVADDLTKEYFRPRPWYAKIGPFAELGVKVSNKILPW